MKWVKVEDALPEIAEWVLAWGQVYSESNQCKIPFKQYVVQRYQIERHSNDWVTDSCADYNIEVTHWMPLPTPPKDNE